MAKKSANAPMSKEIVKRLNAMKINAKNEEDARKKLLKILTDNDIDGMEDESIETLLDIAESLVEDTETTEEEEAEELANEAEEEETEEEEEETEESEEEAEEEEEEPEEEEEKPAKKAAPAKKSAPAKKEEKKPAAKKETAKKEKAPKRGVKIDLKNDTDEQKAFKKIWAKMFPESEYEYAWLSTNGCTIKHKGANANRGMITVEACTRMDDDTIKVNLYILLLNKKYEILDNHDIDYQKCWNGAPMLKGITMDEAVEIMTTVVGEMTGIVEKLDKKLGDNRKKMEDNLNKKSAEKAAAKKAPAKKVEPEDDDEEEEDDEPEEKPAKKAPAKKVAKKK